MQSIFVEIEGNMLCNKKKFILGVIYRPPNTDTSVFNEKIKRIMDVIKKENELCCMVGDYNINILNYDLHSPTGEFVDAMSSYAFVPLINRPTRVTATSANLIDNIFTNNFENLANSFQGVFVTDISYHYPIFYINCVNKFIVIEIFVERRIYNETSKQAFFSELENID